GGAVSGIAVGLPTLRARGLAFAVTTLAFSLLCSEYLLNRGYSPIKNWLPGSAVEPTRLLGVVALDSQTRVYWLTIAILAAALVGVRRLRPSRTGRALIGVRDNERAAQAVAVGPSTTLLVAYGVSGFVAGVAGCLFVFQSGFIADSFNTAAGLQVFSMVVVGGLGSIGGAVLGAVY